jgi:hypothetical protein
MTHTIAILIPVCSRNQEYSSIDDTHLARMFIPSFLKTMDSSYRYKIYIGIDDNDVFYTNNIDNIRFEGLDIKICVLTGCNHKPAHAWNKLLEIAYGDCCDFFFQIGDDVEIENAGWTRIFIDTLCSQSLQGIVGPCEIENYQMRMRSGSNIVIENAFFHRRHYEIFNTLFHGSINNWYCDNWLTDVYSSIGKSTMILDVRVKNHKRDARYSIDSCREYKRYLSEGVDILNKYLLDTRER